MNNDKTLHVSDLESVSYRFTMEYGIYKAEVILDENKNLQTVEVGSKGGYWNSRLGDDCIFADNEFEDYLFLLKKVKKKIEKLKEED